MTDRILVSNKISSVRRDEMFKSIYQMKKYSLNWNCEVEKMDSNFGFHFWLNQPNFGLKKLTVEKEKPKENFAKNTESQGVKRFALSFRISCSQNWRNIEKNSSLLWKKLLCDVIWISFLLKLVAKKFFEKKKERSYRESNSDYWIQSPMC